MDTSASSVPSISPWQLAALIGTPDAPLILDVRREEKFAASPRIIATAQRCAPEDVAAFAVSAPPRKVVVYCVYGHNVSAEAVALLRNAGWDALALAGGIEGGQDGVDRPDDISAWRASPAPTVAKPAGGRA